MDNENDLFPPEAPRASGAGGRYAFNCRPAAPVPAPETEPTPSGERLLFRLGLAVGAGFLLHLLLRRIFLLLLRGETPLHDMYFGSIEGAILLNLLYSYLVVGMPFLIVWLFLRRVKPLAAGVPLGGAYDRKNALLLVFAGVGLCFIGDLATNYFAIFADSMGVTFNSYMQALAGDEAPQGAFGLLLYLLQGALVPALVEEFVFRGVILQPLRKFGDWFAILSTALLFGLMHGNMTQVPFAIIAGVALGYVAVVSGSLWVSVAVHFFNNFIAVCASVIGDRYSDGASLLFSNVSTFGFISVGVLALIFYLKRNPAWRRLYPGEYAGTKKSRFFLAPTLFISLALLLCLTLSDIPALAPLFSWL